MRTFIATVLFLTTGERIKRIDKYIQVAEPDVEIKWQPDSTVEDAVTRIASITVPDSMDHADAFRLGTLFGNLTKPSSE